MTEEPWTNIEFDHETETAHIITSTGTDEVIQVPNEVTTTEMSEDAGDD